ncbi:class I SAM-dependent methyltransferase [uncultured Thiodictyon sp.]|uniref:class I SAM-dependent methyltransferase n=1 Tax=uncultured Thiodictyon sp. TaxID=1846217 RepID=UPI0025D8F723|nr:class I SAM-dependent methyltransferase [uncultured Thiodictyon sp.]
MLSLLTGQPDTERLQALTPADIAERWRTSLGIDVGSAFAALPVIEYWRCKTTGLAWYSPPAAAGEGGLYAQLERFDWYYVADKWEFQAALSALSQGSRVLEVGVGSGHFLRAAAARGLGVRGVELNPVAAARVRALGFEVFETSLSMLAQRGLAPFDAICAFQVLEHVPDPRGLLADMLKLLRPGGQLVLSVPNAAVTRVIDPQRTNLLDQPPHHISHWDAGVFRALAGLLPLRLIKLGREPLQAYHVDWFVSAYTSVLRRQLSDPVSRVLLHPRSQTAVRRLLTTPIRQLIPGHTLLAVMRFEP